MPTGFPQSAWQTRANMEDTPFDIFAILVSAYEETLNKTAQKGRSTFAGSLFQANTPLAPIFHAGATSSIPTSSNPMAHGKDARLSEAMRMRI